jgi:hypothetical protein
MLIPLPSFTAPGYTNLNIAGSQSQQTEVLASQTLAAGDVTLSAIQGATIGLIEVSVGHASNAFIVPANVGKFFFVVNNDAALAASIKTAGTTAIAIAATKNALVYVNSAGACERLTADV